MSLERLGDKADAVLASSVYHGNLCRRISSLI